MSSFWCLILLVFSLMIFVIAVVYSHLMAKFALYLSLAISLSCQVDILLYFLQAILWFGYTVTTTMRQDNAGLRDDLLVRIMNIVDDQLPCNNCIDLSRRNSFFNFIRGVLLEARKKNRWGILKNDLQIRHFLFTISFDNWCEFLCQLVTCPFITLRQCYDNRKVANKLFHIWYAVWDMSTNDNRNLEREIRNKMNQVNQPPTFQTSQAAPNPVLNPPQAPIPTSLPPPTSFSVSLQESNQSHHTPVLDDLPVADPTDQSGHITGQDQSQASQEAIIYAGRSPVDYSHWLPEYK